MTDVMPLIRLRFIVNLAGCRRPALLKESKRLLNEWYLDNEEWWQRIISGEYQDYCTKMYGDR